MFPLSESPSRLLRGVHVQRDTLLYSEECRQEQIELDEAREREMRYRHGRLYHHRTTSPYMRLAVGLAAQQSFGTKAAQ
ncbi:hypothetical protein Taro_004112 [Colocasia esculenta]|uniref:Uncharacterized protein n=1 Tax=Colocasia esculenta TaxID=4460 RepID=A0A843TLH1_COLES|nr:hypothetical protein [Colocasia esculenta]